MEATWFCLVAVMIAIYVVLDGFDIGAGITSLLIARNDLEKRTILGSIAPVWDGNEVWLIAGGGVLFFAFPKLYASSFQGFYLPLIIVLWLLMFRGLSIELRNHISNPIWTPFWDFAFGSASLLLAVFYGAALGNVVRGVPLNERGDFFLPLWTNFTTGGVIGILDWFTVLVGLLAAVTLTMHGALWIALKTEGELSDRARRLSRVALPLILVLTAGVTLAAFSIQPVVGQAFAERPWGYLFPALAVAGLVGVLRFGHSRDSEAKAFVSSCLYILGMLTSAAQGLFPYVLPAVSGGQNGLTIQNAAAPEHGLAIGFAWWIPGMLMAVGYFVFSYRRLAGKVNLSEPGH